MNNLTVVIPFRNGHSTINRLLDCLPDNLPVIIVDDDSKDGLDINKNNIRVIHQEREYFSGAINRGIAECDTDVLVLNQDIWFESGAWQECIGEARDKRAGIAGDGVKNHPAWPSGYVQGTFMYLSRKAINQVGEFDAERYPLWGATCEWQLRACRLGFSHLLTDVSGMQHERDLRKVRGMRFGSAIADTVLEEPDSWNTFIRTPPLVSVIIPCRNYGRYLPDAINSLVGGETSLGNQPGQTFHSWEAIIVDDLSTDNSWEIAQELSDDRKGIRAIRMSERGYTPGTLNHGIESSYGKYIAILSADDMLEPEHLETLLNTCEANQHSVAHCDLTVFRQGERHKIIGLMREYDFDRILKKNMISAGIMYPRQCWQDTGGYNLAMKYGREDWCFNVACGSVGWCAVHSGHSTYLYRREGQNRSLRTGSTPVGTEKPHSHDLVGFNWLCFFRQQMETIYSDLYTGRKQAMGCGGRCGGSKKKSAATRQSKPIIGEAGMEAIEYIGNSAGAMTWYGKVTRKAYKFGGSRRVGFIDSQDLNGFLERVDMGRRVFRRISTDEIQSRMDLVTANDSEKTPPPPTEQESHSDLQGVLNPSEMTIKAIKELSLSPEQAKRILVLEMTGKARAGAISYLKEVIDGQN